MLSSLFSKIWIFLSLGFLLLCFGCQSGSGGNGGNGGNGTGVAQFYVAPNGNDAWSGTLSDPNADLSDGPFLTFDHARAVVQGLDKTGLNQIVVQFRAGTYFLPATENFTMADSGTASTPILYQNFPGETSVFSGGQRVQHWTNTGGNLWQATLPTSTQYFENLFYNDVRRLRPRLAPNATTQEEALVGSYLRVADTYILTSKPTSALDIANCPKIGPGQWECFDRFYYNSSDPIADNWQNLSPAAQNPCGQATGNPYPQGDIELIDFEKFTTSKLRVSCVDTTNHVVYLTGPTTFGSDQAGYIPLHRYLVENVKDAFTQPGQWFLDRSSTPWVLSYLANPGEDPNVDSVVIPQLPAVLVASGLQYVTFQGLTFEHDNFTVPPQGHLADELNSLIPAAVSFQNSQHLTFDSGIVRETSGAGLEIISCVGASSPTWCVQNNSVPPSSNIDVKNSAFYDLGASGVRIGEREDPSDTDANLVQFNTVENSVVEGWGRTIPSTFGIAQGVGHDNLYTHNDVYDGYHVGISISISGSDFPTSSGPANNTISFNHVHDTHQGILNDGGAIRVGAGNGVFTAAGNKILNNKVHDINSAAVLDGSGREPGCAKKNPDLPCDGYGGHGLYLDNQTGLTDVENNLVYRVSDSAVNFPKTPPEPNEANILKNNIFAFARRSMINDISPYSSGSTTPNLTFVATSNIFYFDRNPNSPGQPFFVQSDCTFVQSPPYTYRQYQQWDSNLYYRTDGTFDSDPLAFHYQPNASGDPDQPCINDNPKLDPTIWSFVPFSDPSNGPSWQALGQDVAGNVANPGFAHPEYPFDDYSLPNGSPGYGFVVFDPNQAGRSNPVIEPPDVPRTFFTQTFDPATDF